MRPMLQQDDSEAGRLWTRAENSSSRGVPRTTMELSGWAMFLIGVWIPFAARVRWWTMLVLVGVLVLILMMAMVQERWLMRERHRQVVSALKGTGAVSGLPGPDAKQSRHARTAGGGKRR